MVFWRRVWPPAVKPRSHRLLAVARVGGLLPCGLTAGPVAPGRVARRSGPVLCGFGHVGPGRHDDLMSVGGGEDHGGGGAVVFDAPAAGVNQIVVTPAQ